MLRHAQSLRRVKCAVPHATTRLHRRPAVARSFASFVQERTISSTTTPLATNQWAKDIEILLNNKQVDKANVILANQQKALCQISSPSSLRSTQLQVLDGWLERQQELLLATYTNGESQRRRRSDLKEICHCVDAARVILQDLAPTLFQERPSLVAASEMDHDPTTTASPITASAVSFTTLEQPEEESLKKNSKLLDVELSQRCDAVLAAWAAACKAGFGLQTRVTRGIPQRAQFLLHQMEEAASVKASVESYNSVIQAWAYSNEHLRGTMADRVFSRIRRPNGDSYRHVIAAWCHSRDRRAAFTATGHLMKMLRKLEGDEDFEPTLEEYKAILKAWTRAEDKSAPVKANLVLGLMEQAYEKEQTNVRADLDCYRYVLQTAASRPDLPNLGRLVDEVLVKMRENFIAPDSECFAAAIRTWKNAALNPTLTHERDDSVKRTLELLSEMKNANERSMTDIRVSTENVNDAIEALSVSRDPRRIERAERLLQEMEESLADPESLDPEPNADSYRLVLHVWGTSKSMEKVPRAMAILWRMKENYEHLSSLSSKDQFLEVFNTFVKVCGSVRTKNSAEAVQVFREALGGIEGTRTVGLKPNAASYAALIEAIGNLLPVGIDRQRVVEQVFRLCCDDGMVDDHVIRKLMAVATEEQYTRLVLAESEYMEGFKMVPEAWTRNALGGRVVDADGRRTTPLTVDGNLAVTPAMKDFQMRRLRDKRNRNLLQGGRLRAKETLVQ